jgi:hypothetical protein
MSLVLHAPDFLEVLVLDGNGDTVHVYEILAVVFCGAGTDMDKSSSAETLKFRFSNSAGLLMLEL